MKKFASFFVLSLFVLSGCSTSHISKYTPSGQGLNEVLISSKMYSSTSDLAESVTPAIVGISASSPSGTSVGAGACVREGGIIITNSHVINGAESINVYLSNGDIGNASTIWEDTIQDLAIIKADISIPYLPLSSDENLNVGEDVVAVGTPLSLVLKHSFTKGIVSALNRTLKVETDYGESYMQNLIQHDASLNPGNSGGPLLNLNGEIVGINTLKISGGEGIGFAIPSRTFSTLVDSIVASKTKYETPYLGTYGFDGEIANYLKQTDINRGFYVLDIADNSPLKDSPLVAGCVITKFNNKVINNTADLKNELYKFKYGDSCIVSYYDGEGEHFVKIKLSKNDLR